MCLSATAKETARRGQAPGRHGRPAALALLLALPTLAGCGPVERFYDSKLTPDTPIEWWQDLQGGRIAAVRPPPPGVADPYPNLANVPTRPVLPDAATRRALQARLTAERDRTKREGERDPIGTAAPPAPAMPATPAAAKPAPDPDASVVVFDAATAPPAPPVATSPAPAPSTASATVPAASSAPASLAPAPSAPAPAGVAPPRPESGPLPDLPGAAPALPRLAGLPAGASRPATRPQPSVDVRFPRGSATLPDAAIPALRGLAQRRAGGAVVVVAGGGAGPGSASQQADALPTALRRARAIAQALMEAGVPADALRYDVSASGSSGARLPPL